MERVLGTAGFDMAPKFGTSGLRGLVTELTDALLADYVRAFARACPTGTGVCIGWDLRPSSPAIADVVATTLAECWVEVQLAGALPTPALALGAATRGMGAIMVTGSHIPADRNGLKFFTPDGEIDKEDEARIEASRGLPPLDGTAQRGSLDLSAEYRARYAAAFGPDALQGLRVGVYQHSSVARELMVDVLADLGAEPVALGWSDTFIPVDTEAVDTATRAQLAAWASEARFDAIVSTDGDADRPMVTDATGTLVPGDILGPLTAGMVRAKVVVTPVSSNTGVDAMRFDQVVRTRIGSPFVIAGMAANQGHTVGYEANGGFLLGFEATGPAGPLPPLLTRDCLLPIIAPLAMAKARGLSLAQLVALLPKRVTATGRLQGIAPETAAAFLDRLHGDADQRAAFAGAVSADLGAEIGIDDTDGLRMTFEAAILHLRPSGNAPEFRCYVESTDSQTADALAASALAELDRRLR